MQLTAIRSLRYDRAFCAATAIPGSSCKCAERLDPLLSACCPLENKATCYTVSVFKLAVIASLQTCNPASKFSSIKSIKAAFARPFHQFSLLNKSFIEARDNEYREAEKAGKMVPSCRAAQMQTFQKLRKRMQPYWASVDALPSQLAYRR